DIGIYQDATLTVTHCTIYHESASSGIYDFSEGDIYIVNCIIWTESTAGLSIRTANDNGELQVGQCIVKGEIESPTFTDDILPFDPMFINPAFGNFQITASSPAYDSGNPTFTFESTDLVGNPRVQDTEVDMGCFESSDCSQINDVCANAIALEMDGDAIFGSNRCATNTADEATACFINNGRSVWYSFEAPQTGTVEVISTWLSKFTNIFNYRQVILSGECGNFGELLVCDNDNLDGNGENTLVAGLTPGETYYIRADGFDQQQGRFTIRVEERPVPAVPGVLYVDQDATGTNDGSSWENALTHWGDISGNLDGIEQVWVAEGFYLTEDANGDSFLQSARQDLEIYGGFAGNETSLSARIPFGMETIISCDIGVQGDFSDNYSRPLAFQGYPDDSRATYFMQDLIWESSAGQSVLFANNCDVTADRCVFRNSLGDTNTIYVNIGGTFSFTNCLFHHNNHVDFGPFLLIGAGGDVEFINCTITEGNASQLGSLSEGEEMRFTNCILWNNNWAQPNNSSNKPTMQYSVYEDASQFEDLGNNVNANPLFINALNNDYTPAEGSPAIGIGLNSAISQAFDLNREDRIQGVNVDAGCFESQFSVSGCTDTSAENYNPIAVVDDGSCILGPQILYVDLDATGTGDGSSWENAVTTWGEINDHDFGKDQIWIAEGTYLTVDETGTGRHLSLSSDISIYGGFDGTEASLSERDPFDHPTIVSCDLGIEGDFSDNYGRPFNLNPAPNNSLANYFMEDITFTGANDEGIIIVYGANASFSRCIWKDNHVELYPIYLSGGSIYTENCLFHDNSCPNVFSLCTVAVGGDIEFVNTTFSRNSVATFGIHQTGESIVLRNCIVWENEYTSGQAGLRPIVEHSIYDNASKFTNGGDSFIDDPKFSDPDNGDFTIGMLSQAVSLGNAAFVTDDLDLAGNDRFNAGVDAGVYESAFFRWACSDPNAWNYDPYHDVPVLDYCIYEPECPGDFDNSGEVNSSDLLFFLAQFGEDCGSPFCGADLNGDGFTDSTDLLTFLSRFGEYCPPIDAE
ncbi:MAG: choice-of-anchor Q domain-containing protein, partial [Bacteroidota bacterium]